MDNLLDLLKESLRQGNFPYLFAGYSLIWLVTFLYILRLMRRQQELRRELEALKQARKKE